MVDIIYLPPFPSIIEYQVIESPIYEIVILSEAEINKFTIMIIKEELKKHGIVPKSTSKKSFSLNYSRILWKEVIQMFQIILDKMGTHQVMDSLRLHILIS